MLDPGLASVVLRSGEKGLWAHTERWAASPQAVKANPAMGDWGIMILCEGFQPSRVCTGLTMIHVIW